LLALTSSAQAQEDEPISIGKRLTMRSEILQEERPYWVYLPASYADDAYPLQRYPVLYLLDGDAHFHSASGVVQFMGSGLNGNLQIPELIIVAIPNTNRTRDLTPTHATTALDGSNVSFLEVSGGGEKFLRFLQEELFAQIESTYRTLPYRVLVGHSLGGLFSLYALLEAPSAFQAHIAIDPSLWWDERLLVRRVESEIGDRELSGSAYISLANNPDVGLGDPQLMMQAGRDFAAALQSVSSAEFRSELSYFEGEDHGSVPLLSLYHGLLFTFDGYKLPTELVIGNPSGIRAHFDRISARLGVRLLPPGQAINDMGFALLYQLQDVDKAIELFEMNVENFPASYRAHSSLAEAYLMKGERALAIERFETAVELNPQDRNASERLRELTAP
jgi:predicted alpha/beta superfamily hydrolase